MSEQHLRAAVVEPRNGKLLVAFQFTDIWSSEVFTPGESISVSLLKLEKLRVDLQKQARLRGRPPGGLKI